MMAEPCSDGDGVPVSRSTNKAIGIVGEQQGLTTDLAEVMVRPEMPWVGLATCNRRGVVALHDGTATPAALVRQ